MSADPERALADRVLGSLVEVADSQMAQPGSMFSGRREPDLRIQADDRQHVELAAELVQPRARFVDQLAVHRAFACRTRMAIARQRGATLAS